MRKKLTIISVFTISSGLVYLVMVMLLQRKISSLSSSNDWLATVGGAAYYVTVGYMIYFGVLNAVALVGLVISWRRHDPEALGAFRILLAFTLVFTAVMSVVMYS